MGVDEDAVVRLGAGATVGEDHVRRLARDAGELDEILHPARYLAVEARDEGLGAADDRLRLLAEEARRVDERLDVLRRGGAQRSGIGVSLEQRSRPPID